MGEARGIRENHWLLRWSKWRIVRTYWLVQSIVLVFAIPLWAWQMTTDRDQPLGDLDQLRIVGEAYADGSFWVLWGVVNGVIIGLQTVLLLPVYKPRPRVVRGAPLLLSVAVMGVLVAALAGGLVYGLFVGLHELLYRNSNTGPLGVDEMMFWLIMLGVVLASWSGGSLLLWGFCTRRLRAGAMHEDVLRRVASRLFLGTMVETAAMIPLDVMVRRKTECYCVAGSYVALTVCGAVGLVVLGPLMVLPYVAARRKRWWQSRCDACGYDLASLLSAGRGVERCPECGAGWREGGTRGGGGVTR